MKSILLCYWRCFMGFTEIIYGASQHKFSKIQRNLKSNVFKKCCVGHENILSFKFKEWRRLDT